MFTIVKCPVCVLALAVAAGAISPASAQAQQRNGAVDLQNHSAVTLSIQMRLGTSGPWTNYTIPSRTNLSIHFALDCHGRVSTPHIRFDNSRGENVSYALDFYEVDLSRSERGKPYKFKYDVNAGWDLFTAE